MPKLTVESAIAELRADKALQTITIFVNNEGKRIPSKVRVTKQKKADRRPAFLVTYGPLNYAERRYAVSYWASFSRWPANLYKYFPKKRDANG